MSEAKSKVIKSEDRDWVTKVEVIQTDDGIFYDHEGTMLEVPCQWFALCENHATTTQSHPILGDVPICGRCLARVRQYAE